ncbi:hypothetical protein S83_062924 [Arachis hypogaea]|uniref:Uncharacterized protein n=1 Tax=Arachis hypogaea TaxID=3818 RepID=A0A444Y351_ARAHY|nr:Nuclear-pore anchor [Arachis hypogaea]RYQ96328.1 hypothetical protein Ahy_B08g092045 [Arachis hypogaea]
MPLFLPDEEFVRCSGDIATVVAKADAYIRSLLQELDTLRARSHAVDINAEQNCSLVEQKFLTLASDFSALQSRVSELDSELEQRNADLVDVQSQKHQVQLQSVEKDREIERLRTEVSELHKSKRQLIELNDQKDLQLSEKNASNKRNLEKIVHLNENAAQKETRISELEAELGKSKASCTRFEQEKEILERQNAWLNDELTTKVNSYFELRKKHTELDADMSSKLADVERQFKECSKSLQWNKDRVRELETKLKSLQEDLISAKDAAAAKEERLSAELSTVNKLNDLYKESSEEWSRKAADLEGVIKAIESQLKQVEDDYKERLAKEVTSRNQAEKEAADLKGKLERLEAETEARKKTTELRDHSLTTFAAEPWTASIEDDNMTDENNLLVPKIPVGVSGTALASSLLRDGWSLAKMYAKYQEVVDALRHEQLGRKESETILHRILKELEEKAEAIKDERAEHEEMVEAYSSMNQKLQNSLTKNTNLEKSIQELKADLRRRERDYNLAQKEIDDLQKQVTLLLKECQDIQLRCGSIGYDIVEDVANIASRTSMEMEAEKIISEHLLTFKDINNLVEQNVQLRSLVRSLSGQIENQEVEFKERLELELRKCSDEAASKVAAVLQRAEEQGRMIESLHTSVAMYKRLYEEEHSHHLSQTHSSEAHTVVKDVGRNDLAALIDSSQEVAKKSLEKAAERVRCLEEDMAKARSDITVLRSERDKMELEAKFSKERLDSFMKEFEHEKAEANSILARNVEFSQLIADYQRKLCESSESLNAAEELSRRLTMELSVLKHENEVLSNAEKRASDEVHSLSERVQRLQASLGTIQSAEEVREEARVAERVKKEEYIKKLEREWAEAKRDLQEERENMWRLMQDRDQTIKNNTMRQVEDLSKELANALSAVASAESRAAVAEAKLSGLQRKMGSVDDKVFEKVGVSGFLSSSSDVVAGELQAAKEEIEKLKEEADANKAHMLQYKSIAEVNEDALKRIETALENYKVEAGNEKKALEGELHSLREKVVELKNETSLKCEEVASVTAGKDKALSSALAEITTLKEEILAKCSQISAMEVQISGFKEQLDEEHKKWRSAQNNYERQVILQSETIQELKNTSEALATLQGEASELRKLADAQKFENSQLKAKWEEEKTLLEKSRNDVEKKYDEINEQNKILHSHLEALHIQRAEKERNSAGIPSGSSSADTFGDAGLQTVISYLRLSKEMAEKEVSLLKQQKLRLQLQLEGALKAVEFANASLEADRAKSKSRLFTEEEFKSLQLQVREMNLLRESNMQLREENKHNFEECQKLRELAHKARAEVENLEKLLREREMELAGCKNETEGLKREKDDLCHKVSELLERSKNIDVEDYDRSKKLVRDLQERLKEKDSKLDEMGKTLSVKQDSVARLEQDLSNCRVELAEREKRINDITQSEVSLKHEVDRHKKMLGSWKIKNDLLSKEVQQLSKQLDEIKQGKKLTTDTTGDHAMKEEKDTRIQTLEKTVERQRDELKKEREENQMEKGRRIKTEKAIKDSYNNVEQEKAKFINELERHKEALKRLSEEVEKVKDVGNLPEGANAVQLLSGSNVDNLAAPYVSAVESFQKEAHSVFSELGGHVNRGDATTVMDTSAATASVVHASTPSVISLPAVGVSGLSPKATIDSDKRPPFSRPSAEPRKTGRKLVRPRLVKPDEPQGDTEMFDAEGLGKPGPSEAAPQTGFAPSQPLARKRVATTSTTELREESVAVGEKSSDAPMLKKSKRSESPEDNGEEPVTEHAGTNMASEELESGELPQGQNAGVVEAQNEDGEIPVVKDEEANNPQNLDGTNQEELHDDKPIDFEENQDQAAEVKMQSDDMHRDHIEPENQQSSLAVGGETEEGELLPETGEPEGGNEENQDSREGQSEPVRTPEPSPTRADDEALEAGEINSPELSGDDKNDEGDLTEEAGDTLDKAADVNESTTVETDKVAEPTPIASEVAPTTSAAETSSSRPVTRQSTAHGSATAETDDVKHTSPLNSSSTTINLLERARERAQLRQAGVVSTVGRARGRVPRGRGVRGRGRRPPTNES